jgi:hypothetical protein
MSQDNERCSQCGELCGHDDNKGYWPGCNLAICSRCKNNISYRFCAFFGIDGCSNDYSSLCVEWPDVVKILSRIKRDNSTLVSYIVTDKEVYEKNMNIITAIEKG